MNSKQLYPFDGLVKSIVFVLVMFAPAGWAGSAEKVEAGDSVTLSLPADVELELVRIGPGSFMMGSPESERGRYSDEGPYHKVAIGYDFYMGKYEVTQKQWKSVMKTNPGRRYGVGDEYPVSHVSWDDCQRFVGELNRLDIGLFRLPSEAEWEYACRAGTQSRFYFGDSLESGDECQNSRCGKLPGNRADYMWFCGGKEAPDNPDFGTIAVGQLKPNAFGLYDMHGNVWEWCLDQYHFNYEGAPTDGRTWVDWDGAPRVLRGGGWGYHARKCRSAVRCGYSAGRGYTFHGLRLVWFPYKKYSQQWFKSWMAEVIGDNMISYQTQIGAWPKNMHMEAHGYQGEKFTKNWATSIDNGATTRQMNFMAKLYHATGKKPFKKSFIKGLDYLIEAQYGNGGWPQRYPLSNDGDYGDFITFNDNAMVNVMNVMRSILDGPNSDMVDNRRRNRVKRAYEKGFDCIVKCQVVVNGRPTVWCAQHDPKTLEPRHGRSYELASLSGGESAGVVLFLMSIDKPSARIIKVIEDAVAWYQSSKITGIRFERVGDTIEMIKDANAPTLWARFYDVKSGRAIFSDYDGVLKYDIRQLHKDRLFGYRWYVRSGDVVLAEYPKWKKRIK